MILLPPEHQTTPGEFGGIMYQRAITLQEFADLFECMENVTQADVGSVLTTTGTHPILGACVAIQDAAPQMLLLSELPFEATEMRGAA